MLTITIYADILKLDTLEDVETNTEEEELSLLLVRPEVVTLRFRREDVAEVVAEVDLPPLLE